MTQRNFGRDVGCGFDKDGANGENVPGDETIRSVSYMITLSDYLQSFIA